LYSPATTPNYSATNRAITKPITQAHAITASISKVLPDAISRVIENERLLPVERDFLRKKVFPVIDVAAALKTRQAMMLATGYC
jgi:hypothetical protein